MKKIFAMMLAALTLSVACTEEKTLPAVSFTSALPVTSDGEAVFSIAVSNYSGTDAVTVPFTLGGDAVEGVDYTISAKEFVVGGANPVTEVTVTTLKYDTGKKVTLTLNAPAGWTLGNYAVSEYALSQKLGWVSFVNKKIGMSAKATVVVEVYDGEGKALTLENGDEIEVSVDTEKSTAVENTHFKFSGDKSVVIAAGQTRGSLTIELIGEAAVAGNDLIVLNVNPGEKYNIGTNAKVSISILGSDWVRLDGEWQIAKMHSSVEHLRTYWGTMVTGYEYIPQYDSNPEDNVLVDMNVNDKLVFDMNTLTLTPYFESSFKNYFTGVSNIEPDQEYSLPFNGTDGCWNTVGLMPWGGNVMTPSMKLDNTNRYFSETEVSEDKTSILGYGLSKDEDGNDLLYIYVIDCMSKSFFPEFMDQETMGFAIYAENPPVLVNGWADVFMIASFKKVVK